MTFENYKNFHRIVEDRFAELGFEAYLRKKEDYYEISLYEGSNGINPFIYTSNIQCDKDQNENVQANYISDTLIKELENKFPEIFL